MSLTGTVHDGVVVLDNSMKLPDGTRVDVVVHESSQPVSPLAEMLLSHAGKAKGLPDDAAEQHDHYLYGTPKQ